MCRSMHIACIFIYSLLICFFSYQQPNVTFSAPTDAENEPEYTQTSQRNLNEHQIDFFFQKAGKYNRSIKYVTKVPGVHGRQPSYCVILLSHPDNAQCTHKNQLRTYINSKINKDTNPNVS